MYLSFLRINIALESGGHRVQLQSIVDEGEASTTRRSRVDLYSHRINNAVESALYYRVQLQRNVDEEGGKYTEAKPRCTCPLSESTLRQGR